MHSITALTSIFLLAPVAGLVEAVALPGPAIVEEAPPPACAAAELASPRRPLAASTLQPESDSLQALYESGRPFMAFFEDATERRALWDENYGLGQGIDPTLVERARAVGGTWHFLAVTVDSCSDSANIIPYLARFVEMVDGVELRIVDPEAGRWVMEAHPTPDGRAATPTILLLDEGWNEVGCFIERPRELRDRIIENPDQLSTREIYDWKMAWYSENAGRDTVQELVQILEAAKDGRVLCGPETG